MKNLMRLVLVWSVLAASLGCGGAGGTTIVGTWRRPATSTQAEVTLVCMGTATAGTVSGAAITPPSAMALDPTCTTTFRFRADYAVSGAALSITGTPGSGTYARTGCTDTTMNIAESAVPDAEVSAAIADLSGSMTASGTTLTITSGSGTATFSRL